MQLRGGAIDIYENVFPSLRVICKVNYDIKNFNVDEAEGDKKTSAKSEFE